MVTTTSLEIDGVAPRERVSPATVEELAAALKAADEAGNAVAPIGGGTQLDFGMPPARFDVAFETTGLNQVVEYEPADLTVTVQAGMRFSDLQKLLGDQGQFLALDPPALEGATIGGLVATNSSGPLRFAYGTARDLVIGTRVANPDGTVTHSGGRVVKNVAGYDLNKLYIGSLGTLAVIVELSFKVAPLPPSTATIVGKFADVDGARGLIGAVVHSPLSPLAIEMVGRDRVVFRVGGYPQAVERQVRDLTRLIGEHGGERVDAPDTIWEDLAGMRRDAQRRDVVLKAAAPISTSATLVDILERKLAGLDPVVWSHAGNGVAYGGCNAPSDGSLIDEIRREVTALGKNASLVVQRCPTVLKRSVDVWGEVGSSIALMRAIKAKLDPKNTLNPGRYVGGL